MRVTPTIDATVDEVDRAKETAISLIGSTPSKETMELFYCENLVDIENGIKNLNEFSNKTWILSSILLFTLVYNNELYTQSGLTWQEYAKQSRERLGIDQRDITEQLSAARFFIKYHKALERAGFSPNSANRKLARAELALSLSNSIDDTINHLVNDTWSEFKEWYTTFKDKKLISPTEYKRTDIDIQKSKVYINGVEAVTVSDNIPVQDKERIEKYIVQIFETLRQGYEPAIVSVYDEKEASLLPKLRDKHRQGR